MQKELEEYGFSDKEAKVYIALLQLGGAHVDRIAALTRIPRTTVYDIVRSLGYKGFVSHIVKKEKSYYEAAEPTKLVEDLEEKKVRILEIIPKLQEIKKTVVKKPTINFYEEKEGLKTVLEDVLGSRKEIFIIGNHSQFIEHLKWSGKAFTEKRVKRNIAVKFIGEVSKEAKKLIPLDKKELRITKLLSELNDIKAEVHIYANKIACITLQENQPIGLIIEDKELHKLFKTLFMILWDKTNKKKI